MWQAPSMGGLGTHAWCCSRSRNVRRPAGAKFIAAAGACICARRATSRYQSDSRPVRKNHTQTAALSWDLPSGQSKLVTSR